MTLYRPLPAIPLRKPLAGTFLDSTDRMPIGESEWRSGVSLPSFTNIDPGAWPGASCLSSYESDWSDVNEQTTELDDKAQTTDDCSIVLFDPFIVYHMLDSVTGASPDQESRFRGYGANWIDVQLSAGIARAFYRGAPEDGIVVDGDLRNPIPRVAATDLTAEMGTPASVHPELAISQLLAAYAACTFAGGAVLHVPPLVLPFLIAHGAVSQVGQRFLGPGGVVVISDPGMPSNRELFSDGSGSDSTAFGTNSIGANYETGDNEAWMFVTGPVFASAGELREPLSGPSEIFDIRRNRWVHLWEQPAIFMYDPACAFAVATFVPSPPFDEV